MNEQELKEILRELEEQGWSPLVCDTPVPFYDTAVRCGQPMEVYTERPDNIMLPKDLLSMQPEFTIWAKGDSMKDVWLTQDQLAEIYQTTQENISMHISNIYADDELDKEGTYKKFLLVRQEGKRQVNRHIDHYNLDMIIALGYRVQSRIAVRFRRWATRMLHEYIQKGFAMDDERLKQGGNRYFRELLQRIRDIRSSERNFYQQVTDIYATSTDYDPRSKTTKLFFSTVQNKMHYAVHEHTAAELIYENTRDGYLFHMKWMRDD